MTKIHEYTFRNCSSLKSIVIHEGVTGIGNWAFDGCSSLAELVLPDSVTNVGDWAFRNCSSLTSAVIPAGVTRMAGTFEGCKSLLDVYYGGTSEQLELVKKYFLSAAYLHPSCKNPVDHWKTESVDATCTEDGYTRQYCGCGHEKNVIISTAAGHDMSGWRVTIPAACTEKGEQRRECSRCDYYETEEIPAHGHTEVVDEAVAATCTEAGLTEGKHCAVCKEILAEQKAVAALGHDMDEWTVTVPATCEEAGTQRKNCSRCDYYEAEEIPAHGHTEVIDEAVAATCTEAGLTEGKHCAVCNKVLTAQITVEALGHDMGEWTVTVPATCEEAGTQRKNCSRCSYFENEEIPATGHSYDVVVTPPTCTEDGCTTHTCHCGDSYTDAFVEKLGHTESIDEAIPPTCTENGFSEGSHCITCGEKLMDQTLIPALGHDFALAEGNITCSTCGESMSVRMVLSQNDL